jgi:glycosyltransferase involved in cell wall biosynthesis
MALTKVGIVACCHSIGGFETKLKTLVTNFDPGRIRASMFWVYPYYKAKRTAPEVRERQRRYLSWEGIDAEETVMKTRFDIGAVWRTVRWIRRKQPDVLYFPALGWGTFLAPLAGWLAKAPVIMREQQNVLDGLYPSVLRTLDRWLLRKTDVVVVPSRFLEDLMVDALHGDRKKFRVIPNGIEAERFVPKTGGAALREELGLPAKAPVVGMVANFVPVKNHVALIRAVPKILARVPEAVFVFIGEGPLKSEMMAMGRSLGVGDHLKFLGFRSDTDRIIPLCTIGMLCSHVETHGIALIEFMACGVPVVAPKVGGIPEIVTHGGDGLLMDRTDPDEIARAVTALLTDPDSLRRFGEAARKKVDQRFTWERMIRSTENLLVNPEGI